MKRLLLWITILTTLFSGGIALTSALGKTAPPPAFAQWFTYPDGSPCPMPCLFGIRPGITKWDEAYPLLKSHPLLMINSLKNQSGTTIVTKSFDVAIKGNADQIYSMRIINNKSDVVNIFYVYLYGLDDTHVTMADVLILFGSPQSITVSPYNGSDATFIQFQNQTLRVTVYKPIPQCAFIPETEIYDFQIRDLESIEESLRFYQWAGFAPLQTYWKRYYKGNDYLYPTDCAP
jgi:hypothetical protein